MRPVYEWEDYARRVENQGNFLARGVLRGLVSVDPNGAEPDVQINVARSMAAELTKILETEGDDAFVRCSTRALTWAMHETTLPEVAIMVGIAIVAPSKLLESDTRRNTIGAREGLLSSPEYTEYAKRYIGMFETFLTA